MRYLRYILTTMVVLALFGGYFTYLTYTGQIEQNPLSNAIVSVSRPYPALSAPKEITLNCNYHDKNLSVSETLYGSLYNYYRTDPAKKSAYLHNEEVDFVFSYDEDGTIKELASKIKSLGQENGLSNDQTLDLGSCLMQGIPYDQAKAARILGDDFSAQPIEMVIPRYPYETLYDNLGICTDKTYLGAAVLNELGYKTAIFTFDKEQHMSLGVAVPEGFGSFGTNFGIMELTGEGFLIGDIPEISENAGLAINSFQNIPKADESFEIQSQFQLGIPSGVVPASAGNTYERIVERTSKRRQLEQLRPELMTMQFSLKNAQALLSGAETQLEDAEARYESKPTQSNYNTYLNIYNQYLVVYNDTNSKLNQYNQKVNLYNNYVAEYGQF